jgi:hypothetical protein
MPYDRPAEHADAGEYIRVLLKTLTKEDIALQYLAIMDQGVPLEQVVAGIAGTAFGEGKVPAAAAYLLIPPLTVLLHRMASAAGIDVVLLGGEVKPKTPRIMVDSRISPNRLSKAIRAGKKSNDDVVNMPKKMGLMKRPEGII